MISMFMFGKTRVLKPFSFSIEGAVAVSNYNSGAAGTWSKLGPFRKFVGDGAINISNLAWSTAISGIEIRKVPSTLPVTGISLSPSSLALTVGQTSQLSKTIAPSNATNQNVTWSSSNINIATVNASGLVTAVAAGSATITATSVSGGFTATSTVSITIPVTGINVSPTTLALTAGQTSQLNTSIVPSNAANLNVTWSSSAATIATVSSSGLVSGIAPGSAVITATTVDGGFTSQSAITVADELITSVKPLYNGIITSMRWRTDKVYGTTEEEFRGMYVFDYDDKYQIKDASWATPDIARPRSRLITNFA